MIEHEAQTLERIVSDLLALGRPLAVSVVAEDLRAAVAGALAVARMRRPHVQVVLHAAAPSVASTVSLRFSPIFASSSPSASWSLVPPISMARYITFSGWWIQLQDRAALPTGVIRWSRKTNRMGKVWETSRRLSSHR